MAILDMGILGGFSGRVGTVVGYRRRGAWFVRAYRPHIKDRKSAAQLEQRSRFKAMIQFASPATPVLRIGLKRMADEQCITEGNAFLRLNHGWFGGGSGKCGKAGEAVKVAYAELQFSRGTLPGLVQAEYTVDELGTMAVRWSSEGGQRGDRVHVYVYCPATGGGLRAEGIRGLGRLQVLLPQEMRGEELHLWAFAESAYGVSKTLYVKLSDLRTDGAIDALQHPLGRDGAEAAVVAQAAGLATVGGAGLTGQPGAEGVGTVLSVAEEAEVGVRGAPDTHHPYT